MSQKFIKSKVYKVKMARRDLDIQNVKVSPCHFCRGQAVLTAVLFFMFISVIITSGAYSVSYKESKTAREFGVSKKSFFLGEAGVEDISYRIIKSKNYDTSETLSLDGATTTTTIADVGGKKEIISTATDSNLVRKIKTTVASNTSGASFYYGVQVGQGGFEMKNNSQIIGNLFSNGLVKGENSNIIKGDVISAGPNGTIDRIHATGTAYAHNILNSTIDKDAYYVALTNTTVGGIKYPGSADQATTSLPITDATITEWENTASSTVISSPCPYKTTSDATIGPVKINCDWEISGNPTVTLAGNIWVKGNINIKNSPIIKIASSLGRNSVVIIADNPANRLTSSKIEFGNSAQIQNSGTEGSYVLFISQNKSAETGGDEKAIKIANSVSGELLVYAGHGSIEIDNGASLREVSGYKIELENSSEVIYKTGLANMTFTSGPSGGYSIDSWQETQ